MDGGSQPCHLTGGMDGDDLPHVKTSADRGRAFVLRRKRQLDLPDVDAARIGDRQTVFSQPLEAQGNRLPDELLSLDRRHLTVGRP